MNARLPLVIATAVLLSACSGTAGTGTNATAPTPTPRPAPASLEKPTYSVQRGTVVDEIKVNGTVAATKQQELAFTKQGFLKVLYVERGAAVKKDQVIAELDQGETPNQLKQAQIARDQAKDALQKSVDRNSFAIRSAELDVADAQAKLAQLRIPPPAASVAKARAALATAKAALEEMRTNTSAAKTQAELALRQATTALPPIQAAYRDALEQWNDVKDKPNDVQFNSKREAYLRADADLKNAESAVAQAQLAYDTAFKNEAPAIERATQNVNDAQADLDGLLKPNNAAAIADARRGIQRAQLSLEQAKSSGGDTELQSRLDAAELEVQRITTQLSGAQLLAPFDGKVAEVGNKPGDAIEAYKPVLTVIDDSEIELLIESITSTDSGKIGVGQQVGIVFSRAPGKPYQGSVVKLPTSATSSAATINPDRAYHVNFSAADVKLEAGDIAQVVFTLQKKDDALWLPPQAVRAFEGRRFVVIKDGDRQRRQDVRIGIVSPERVEVLEGLKEGDVVVGQ